eukprot:snap_masked-scaffold_7-processed-gene-15.23-mRNA-1 protein AED:1.00 eAED:1.00 QI:0/0/0/0/1/1/2/0/61
MYSKIFDFFREIVRTKSVTKHIYSNYSLRTVDEAGTLNIHGNSHSFLFWCTILHRIRKQDY